MASSTLSKTPQDAKAPQLEHGASLYSLAWKQFLRHPTAKVALAVLGILYFLAAFADFIAPYPERFGDARLSFAPPTQVHWRNEAGEFVGPFVYGLRKELNLETFENDWTADTSKIYPIEFFVRSSNPRDAYVPFPISLIPQPLRTRLGIRPTAQLRLFGVDAPGRIYLWGSDDVGGDIFGRILFGGRISLTVGIFASLVAVIIGVTLGGLAGFYGGWVDELILRLDEALSAIPGIFLLLALAAVFYPLGWPSSYVFTAIVVVLAFISWGGLARSIRSLVYSAKEQEYAFAAKALGANNWRIIFKHLVPQTLSYIVVVISLAIPSYILTEAVLSFYGLGIQRPSTSWGLMLSDAQRFVGVAGLGYRWWIYLPGLFIFISVLAWNLLGDGLRDAFDPRSRD